MAAEYTSVCRLEELRPGDKRTCMVDDCIVVVVRLENEVYCLDDVCTHDGGPLGEGRLEGYSLVCPRHGARFDVRTGQALTMPATEPTRRHDVKIMDGVVWVRICEGE